MPVLEKVLLGALWCCPSAPFLLFFLRCSLVFLFFLRLYLKSDSLRLKCTVAYGSSRAFSTLCNNFAVFSLCTWLCNIIFFSFVCASLGCWCFRHAVFALFSTASFVFVLACMPLHCLRIRSLYSQNVPQPLSILSSSACLSSADSDPYNRLVRITASCTVIFCLVGQSLCRQNVSNCFRVVVHDEILCFTSLCWSPCLFRWQPRYFASCLGLTASPFSKCTFAVLPVLYMTPSFSIAFKKLFIALVYSEMHIVLFA